LPWQVKWIGIREKKGIKGKEGGGKGRKGGFILLALLFFGIIKTRKLLLKGYLL